MGTESCDEQILYIYTDGEWKPVPNVTYAAGLEETSVNYEEYSAMWSFSDSSETFTCQIDISNKFHMSAKKFKKKLMAYGISRDDADWLCRAVSMVKGKVSYRDIYLNKVWAMDSVSFYEVFTYILIKGECI